MPFLGETHNARMDNLTFPFNSINGNIDNNGDALFTTVGSLTQLPLEFTSVHMCIEFG